MGDVIEPSMFSPARPAAFQASPTGAGHLPYVSFNRAELGLIFSIYGAKVATGEWRDYAIDFLRDRAVFSVFQRSADSALYRIEKTPKLAQRQGAYSVMATTGLVLKRGHDLARVLRVLDKRLKLVSD